MESPRKVQAKKGHLDQTRTTRCKPNPGSLKENVQGDQKPAGQAKPRVAARLQQRTQRRDGRKACRGYCAGRGPDHQNCEERCATLRVQAGSRAIGSLQLVLPAMLSAAMPNLPVAVIGFWEACFRSLVLGVLQGLTEFLPISSTAHLKVVPVLLGWGDPGVAVTAVIQLGSIAAVLAYFRSDLAEVIRGVGRACRHGQWGDPSARMGGALALGTLPTVFSGLPLKLLVGLL